MLDHPNIPLEWLDLHVAAFLDMKPHRMKPVC